MSSRDVPQWLVPAFVRSARAAGAQAPVAEVEATARALIDRWSSPERHFHGVRHLVDTLARVDELAAETHHPDLVRLAVWYHGAVFSTTALKAYARSAGEDKEASAQLALEQLEELGVEVEVRERVAALVLSLRRHQGAKEDIDAQVLCDADLGTVAANPQKYRSYREAVRAEFAHLPLRHYVEARIAVVTRLLERRTIFRTPLARLWEDPARENLTAELARLQAELAAMGECTDTEHLPTSPELDAEDAEREARRSERPVRTPLRDRAVPPGAVDDPQPSSSLTRVAPLRTLPAAHDEETAATAYAVPARPEAATIAWDEAVAQDPDGWETAGDFTIRPPQAADGSLDERSSLETGPEALFATLGTARGRAEPAPAVPADPAQEGAHEEISAVEEEPDEFLPDLASPLAAAPAQRARTALPGRFLENGASGSADEDGASSAMEREPDLDTRVRRRR